MKDRLPTIAALVVGVVAFAGGWWSGRPAPAIETPADAVVQADGSEIVERAPTTPTAKPKQIIPKGMKVERVVEVTVDPAKADCPDVRVDMTLVRDAGGGRRVIASSPDGQIVAGLDVPVEAPTQDVLDRKWLAGIRLDPINQTGAVMVGRAVGRAEIGVEAGLTRNRAGDPVPAVGVFVLWRF